MSGAKGCVHIHTHSETQVVFQMRHIPFSVIFMTSSHAPSWLGKAKAVRQGKNQLHSDNYGVHVPASKA